MSEKSKEVVVAPSQAMAVVPEQMETGLEELGAGDLIIPRLSIIQAQSEGGDQHAGKLSINVTGDLYDSVTVCLLKLNKSRILFPAKYKKDNEPLCRSHNFVTPADDIVGAKPMCDTCELLPGDKNKHKCEYANWTNSEPPRCQECWNLLVVDVNTYIPMWFSVRSTGLKALRKMMSAVSMLSNARRLSACAFQFMVKTVAESNASGNFYVPELSGLLELPAEDKANMLAIRTQLSGVQIKDSKEPDAAVGGGAQEEEEIF